MKPKETEITKQMEENENLRLLREYQKTKDRSIRDEIFNRNTYLVHSIVNTFMRQNNLLPREDLVQEGYLGLMKAIDEFDFSKENVNAFSTAAYAYIRNSILNYLQSTYRTITIPSRVSTRLNKISKIKKALTDELHRNPKDNEVILRYNEEETKLIEARLVKKLGREPTQEELQAELKGKLLTENSLLDTFLYDVKMTSFDRPDTTNDEGEGFTVSDWMADDTPTADKIYDKKRIEESIADVIDRVLDPREKDILLSLNLNKETKITLEMLGQKYHVSPQRISQIEKVAKKKVTDYYNNPQGK